MSLNEYEQHIDNERLRAALSDAIEYLRLMPKSPITTAKIAELQKALQQHRVADHSAEDVAWQIEKLTPAGKVLRVRVAEGELRFETEVALDAGANVPYALTEATLDALINVLSTCRINAKP